jgi:hypothetical protein
MLRWGRVLHPLLLRLLRLEAVVVITVLVVCSSSARPHKHLCPRPPD